MSVFSSVGLKGVGGNGNEPKAGMGPNLRAHHRRNLKIKNIGQLQDDGAIQDIPGGRAPFVVDQKQIAQRLVNEVEADVAGDFLDRTVVLNQCVQKHVRREGIVHASRDQMGLEVS